MTTTVANVSLLVRRYCEVLICKQVSKPNIKMPNSTDNTVEIVALVLKLEREIMDAIESKNSAALNEMVRDDFTYRTHFGAAASKAEFFRALLRSMEISRLTARNSTSTFTAKRDTHRVQRARARAPEGQTERKHGCVHPMSSSNERAG